MPDDPATRFAPDEPTPARTGTGRGADWRTDTPGVTGNRTVLAALTLLALLAIGGVLIGVFTFWLGAKPDPRFVSVPVGQYQHPAWPVNPWSRQDADRIASGFPRQSPVEFESQQRSKFLDLLGRLTSPDDKDAAGRPLVFHITALGAVRDGKLYLLPGDAQPNEPASWIPVEEVLDAFDRAPATRGKLLLLDLAHPITGPFSGVLRDDVAAALHDLLNARSATLSFPVLTACSPGEVSLPADSEHCSGFAFYVAQGLRGAADGYLANKTDAGQDRKVSVPELAAFLSGRVSRWARLVHDRKQTPRLYGPADRGPLFHVPFSRPAESDLPEREPYPNWLVEGWKFRTAQQQSGINRGLPESFARLTAAIQRAEQGWLRSGDTARTEANWDTAKKSWEKDLQDSGGPNQSADIFAKALGAVGRYRLVVARHGRPAPPPDWSSTLANYTAARIAAVPGKPDESAKQREAWITKTQPEKGSGNRIDAAGLVWDAAANAQPAGTRASVAALDDLKADREYSETLLLRALANWEYRRQGISEFPQEQAALLWRAENELSKALALGPDGFEFIKDQLDESAKAYRAGQKNLFTGSFDEVQRSSNELSRAATGFAQARRILERWQQGQKLLDEMSSTLMDTMPAALMGDQARFDGWLETARDATALADQYAPAGRKPSLDPGRLDAAIAKAQRVVEGRSVILPDPFAVPQGKKEPDALAPRAKPSDVLPLLRLVAGPTLPAESRRKVWDTIRADDRTFQEAALGQDAADDAAHDPTTNPTTATEKGRVSESELVVRRAKVSVELLKLAGYSKAPELDTLLSRLERDPASDASVLGKQLYRAWTAELPAQANAATDGGRWQEADRIARITPPGVALLRPAMKSTAVGPVAARQAATVYRVWVRNQLLADQTSRPKVAGAAEFYEALRQDLDLGPE